MNQLLKQMLLVLLCMTYIGCAQAEVYRHIDAVNGKVTYSSTPIKGGKKLILGTPLLSPEEAKLAAERGDAEAQSTLGWRYAEGAGVLQDFKEAVKWLRQAAEQGNAPAQTNIGALYYLGQGVPQDYKAAVKWYRLAVEQGNDAAMVRLGFAYEKGNGVPKDLVLSYMWYSIAAAMTSFDPRFIVISPELATRLRYFLEKEMTSYQIAEAQQLAIKCTANKFKGC